MSMLEIVRPPWTLAKYAKALSATVSLFPMLWRSVILAASGQRLHGQPLMTAETDELGSIREVG